MMNVATNLYWAESARLVLHVIAACVWVGGQIVLAGIVPVIRRDSRELLPVVAQAFAKIAWPAYAVLVATGVWNLWSTDTANASTTYLAVVFVKIALVALAGIATAAHSTTNRVVVRAIGGALSLVLSLVVVYLGVVLTLS